MKKDDVLLELQTIMENMNSKDYGYGQITDLISKK